MSDQTAKGIVYPENTDNTRLWEWFKSLAESADAVIPSGVDVQTFTASGTWTRPSGALWVEVHVQGGGGGSGGTAATTAGQASCAPAGGGGEYARGYYSASAAGSSQSVTVGAGGNGGTAGANAGATGGTSAFGALITAVGGGGGAGGTATNGSNSLGSANGGTGGTGGAFRLPGGDGGNAQIISGTALKYNNGGNSFLASMRRSTGVAAGTTTGFDGYAYGGGASGPSNGATQAAVAGSKGGDGVVIVITYKA